MFHMFYRISSFNSKFLFLVFLFWLNRFASVETAKALQTRLGLHFCGQVKTAHREFPQEELRWTLVNEERGT